MKLDDMKHKLSTDLKPSRYEHTIGVADMAAALAMCWDLDVEKAYITGLLHDCAKGYSIEKQKDLCMDYGLSMTKEWKDSPQLIHAPLGAKIAFDLYGVTDEEILQAITYHTTGKVGMTSFEEIIFIADYIEPNRKMIPNLPHARKLAFSDLNQCMCCILKSTIDYLNKKGASMDLQTIETYEFYKSRSNL